MLCLDDFLSLLMGWNGGGDEDDLLELKRFSNLFGSPEVSLMDGIEGSSKKANPFFYGPMFLFYLCCPPAFNSTTLLFWNHGRMEW